MTDYEQDTAVLLFNCEKCKCAQVSTEALIHLVFVQLAQKHIASFSFQLKYSTSTSCQGYASPRRQHCLLSYYYCIYNRPFNYCQK